MKTTLIILSLFFLTNVSFGQEMDKSYYLISNEYEGITYRMHELIFKNDSIVNEVYKYNCGNKTNEYKYNIKNDSLTIFKFRKNQNKSFAIKNNEFWNSDSKQIYVTNEKLENKESFIIAVEGDIWNGNIYDSEKERSREFNKFLKKRIKSKNKMEQIFLKGYDSYIKYGSYKSAIEYLNK